MGSVYKDRQEGPEEIPTVRARPPRVELGLNCVHLPVCLGQIWGNESGGRRPTGISCPWEQRPPRSLRSQGPERHPADKIGESHDIPQEVQGSMEEFLETTSVQKERPHCCT